MDFINSYAMAEIMRIWSFVLGIVWVALLSAAGTVIAQDEYLPDPETEAPLSADALKPLFSGQMHRGSYNFKMKNFEGFHFEELTSEDGKVIHRMGSRIDMGSWQFVDNQICYDYDSPDLLPACFTFYQRGNCIYHHQETVDGQLSPRFTAVSVIKGETPNCEPPMS